MSSYSVGLGIAAISLAMLTSIRRAGAGAGAEDSIPIVRPLVGRTIPEVVEQFGHPFFVVPLRETGGKLLFFETPHGEKFVIETDVTNHVVDAVVKHPESR
jgi:hypothetical protein